MKNKKKNQYKINLDIKVNCFPVNSFEIDYYILKEDNSMDIFDTYIDESKLNGRVSCSFVL